METRDDGATFGKPCKFSVDSENTGHRELVEEITEDRKGTGSAEHLEKIQEDDVFNSNTKGRETCQKYHL